MPDGRDPKSGRFTKGNLIGVPFKPGNPGSESGYDPSYDDMARRFCLLTNATDDMLAEFIGIGVSTLQSWKKKYPSFHASIRAGKEEADMSVAESASFAATGGMVFEQQAIKVKAADEATGKIVEDVKIVEVKRYIPPNPLMVRMWLMNRSRHWKPENDQPDPKPSQVVNNITNNTTVIVGKVRDELAEIFGDALPGEASDRPNRVN